MRVVGEADLAAVLYGTRFDKGSASSRQNLGPVSRIDEAAMWRVPGIRSRDLTVDAHCTPAQGPGHVRE
jgi:hypothetical protein